MGNVTYYNPIPIVASPMASQDEIQAYLLAHAPDNAIAAVFFIFDDPTNSSTLSGFVLETNTTVKFFKGTYQDPNFFVQLPLQSAVQREITRFYMNQNASLAPYAPKLSWSVGLNMFAHPAIATVSVIGQVLGPFIFAGARCLLIHLCMSARHEYVDDVLTHHAPPMIDFLAACMFSFVSQIGFFVGEKENGLRQALRTMGMTDTSYCKQQGSKQSAHILTIP